MRAPPVFEKNLLLGTADTQEFSLGSFIPTIHRVVCGNTVYFELKWGGKVDWDVCDKSPLIATEKQKNIDFQKPLCSLLDNFKLHMHQKNHT